MDTSLTILWGPGGRVELTCFGDGDHPAVVYDITRIAAYLASYGLTCPRTVCPPCEATGVMSVAHGDGGRALWIDGGGDVGEDDVSWAIAAALETGGVDVFDAAIADFYERDAVRCEHALVAVLVALGATHKAARAFLRRRRRTLDERSIIDVWTLRSAPTETVEEVASLLETRLNALLDAIADPTERAGRGAKAHALLADTPVRPAIHVVPLGAGR